MNAVLVNAVAVITVSDSVSAGKRVDASGPAVKARLEHLGWQVPLTDVVPDEVSLISRRLMTAADTGQVCAIFTTGGTGISARDVTPEATRAVIDREIPGIGELMRAKGRESTPFATLSRAIAGTRGKVLIINLPGSPKGAVESLDAIVEVVPHVLQLLSGQTEHPAAKERCAKP
jgi:molybdenum cofactor synthesis domain-containing protein